MCRADFSPRGTSVPLRRTGPTIRAGGCHQSRPDWGVFDVIHYLGEFVPVTAPESFVERSVWRNQNVDVVRHDDVGMRFVATGELVPAVYDDLRDFRLRQESGPCSRLVRHPTKVPRGLK